MVAVVAVGGGCFVPPAASGGDIACATGADCPDALVCLTTRNRCVRRDAPCIDVGGADAVESADGNACGDGGDICVAGACVPPSCGDGVVSGAETCEPATSAACRADCTACGDGVVNGDEECDD